MNALSVHPSFCASLTFLNEGGLESLFRFLLIFPFAIKDIKIEAVFIDGKLVDPQS